MQAARRSIDPWRPLDVLVERERTAAGAVVDAATIFLAGAECPFSCVFCDLWRYTLEGPTPAGALPAQLDVALDRLAEELGPERLRGCHLKLYNASNFFEPRAVPPADDAALLERLAPFPRVVVECHPRLVRRRCLDFGLQLAGQLEVALGLETVHPEAQPRLGKQASLADFERAFERLLAAGLAVRAFVLVGAPFVPADEAAEWAVRSACWAFERGAEQVSLIPLRGELLPGAPRPRLEQLEEALERCLAPARQHGAVVTADLWDLERLADSSTCPACFAARKARLERLNLSGEIEPPISCLHAES